MPDALDSGTALILGEVRGQLREVVHNQNSQAQNLQLIGEKLAKLDNVPDELSAIRLRLTQLETDKHRRDGLIGGLQAMAKSPALAWLAAIATGAWALLTGKINL